MNHKAFRLISAIVFVGVLITQFNNCGSFSSSTPVGENSVTCVSTNCVTPTLNNLSVSPLNLNGGQIPVTAAMAEFNVGGACNEGGYPYNKIRWELVLNNQIVRTSSMPGVWDGYSTADTSCVNGRFSLDVNLAAMTTAGGDPVNRIGLMQGTGTARVTYLLNVIIYGQNSPSDPGVVSTSSLSVVQLAVF